MMKGVRWDEVRPNSLELYGLEHLIEATKGEVDEEEEEEGEGDEEVE